MILLLATLLSLAVMAIGYQRTVIRDLEAERKELKQRATLVRLYEDARKKRRPSSDDWPHRAA